MKRTSFIFYRSYWEAISDLPQEDQLQVYQAIAQYSLDLKEPELTGLGKTIFRFIRPQIEANTKKYLNGMKGADHGAKGGRPSIIFSKFLCN